MDTAKRHRIRSIEDAVRKFPYSVWASKDGIWHNVREAIERRNIDGNYTILVRVGITWISDIDHWEVRL